MRIWGKMSHERMRKFRGMHEKLRCINVRNIWRCVHVEGFRMRDIGQTRHDKPRSVRRVEGFGRRVLGQMRQEKSGRAKPVGPPNASC